MTASIFHALAEAARCGESVALGILSGVNGSSPQKVGAKALFHADGRLQGTLGGGCLEAETQRRALRTLKTGRAETFELVLDHDFGWDDGLICGGKVSGVILPNAQNAGEKFWAELAERKAELTWGVRKDFSVAKLAEHGAATRSGPRMAEALRVTDPPSEDGTFPENRHDSEIAHQGHEPAFGVVQASSAASSPGVPPGVCAGREPPPQLAAGPDCATQFSERGDWFYTETLTPPCALWIAGSGHIAQAVAPLALQLDFGVSIFDDRPELANHQMFPREVALRVGPWGELCATPLPPGPTFGLIVTRGHKHDALVLESWIHHPFAFLGMIGSARKARTISEHFIQQKIATVEQMQRVACPVGICIRSRSVMEIAVDILAQYIDRRAVARLYA